MFFPTVCVSLFYVFFTLIMLNRPCVAKSINTCPIAIFTLLTLKRQTAYETSEYFIENVSETWTNLTFSNFNFRLANFFFISKQ